MHHPIALEVHRRNRENTILRAENSLLRALIESMAMGLEVHEMPANEATLLNEILDSL